MKDVLKEFAQELLNTLKESKSFVLAQAPDLCQQLVRYQFASWTFSAIATAALAAVVCPLIYGQWDGWGTPASWIVIIIAVLRIIFAIETMIKLYLAPKIFLMEYLLDLIKEPAKEQK